jgi:transposase
MWTAKNRRFYDRSGLRYPSDLTAEEWAHVAPLIPPAKRGGNRLHVDVREVMNGIMYILSTGCQWRAIPKDLPPRSTLFDYLELWDWNGTLDRIHHALYEQCRECGEREASPSAAIIDSQQFGDWSTCPLAGSWPSLKVNIAPATKFKFRHQPHRCETKKRRGRTRIGTVAECSAGMF